MKPPNARRRRPILPLLGAVIALLAPAMASAQHRHNRVEAEHRAALALLANEQNEAAYEAFRQLYERTREPRALWRMATAEAALQRWVDAEAHMTLALASVQDPWIISERAGLTQTLQRVRARVGSLTIRCATPGATVFIGDRAVTEFPTRVVAGEVEVRVAAEGYVPQTLSVLVPGNVDQEMIREVVLRPVPPPPSRTVIEPPPPPPPPVGPPPPPESRAAPHRPNVALRATGIAAVATGGAALALGGVALVLRNGAATSFNDDTRCWVDNGAVRGGDACARQADATGTWQALGVVSFVAGGVLAATGAILLGASSGGTSRARSTALRVVGGPGDVGLGLGGAW